MGKASGFVGEGQAGPAKPGYPTFSNIKNKHLGVCISSFIYSATAFARGTYINYFMISFYIVARYYRIGILRRE
jgi:hypothetical protein